MIADRIGQCKVFLPIYHKNNNFLEKKNSQVMKEREICIKRLKDRDWLINTTTLNVIGLLSCPIKTWQVN